MSSWKEFLAGIFIGVLSYILLLRILLPSPLMILAAILTVAVVVIVIIWKFNLKWVGTVDPGDLKRFRLRLRGRCRSLSPCHGAAVFAD